jgi:hypothetical protein
MSTLAQVIEILHDTQGLIQWPIELLPLVAQYYLSRLPVWCIGPTTAFILPSPLDGIKHTASSQATGIFHCTFICVSSRRHDRLMNA